MLESLPPRPWNQATKSLVYYKKRDFRIIMYHLMNNICGDEIVKSAFDQNRGKFQALNVRIFQEKGVFLGSNVCEKGEFFKLENADMSSFTVLTEGAGIKGNISN